LVVSRLHDTVASSPAYPKTELSIADRILHLLSRLFAGSWRLAKAHDLNPWVFIAMSAIGWGVHALVYLPWLQGKGFQLALLILLRFIALVIPAYILIKGKGIARAFNTSILAMFIVNTAWHVCYYVYL
jgi:hypothetical protein